MVGPSLWFTVDPSGHVVPSPGLSDSDLNDLVGLHLKKYEMIILALYLPGHIKLRHYLSENLNHLDALSGDRILITTLDPPTQDLDTLVTLWAERLGQEHENQIRELVSKYRYDERASYAVMDAYGVAYGDLPCLVLAHPTHTTASRIRIPDYQSADKFEIFFLSVLDVAKGSIDIPVNNRRRKLKFLLKRKLLELKGSLPQISKELEDWGEQVTHLKKSIFKLINPFSFITLNVGKILSKLLGPHS